MKLQRDITTWTLDDDLREKFGLAAADRRPRSVGCAGWRG